MELCGLSPFSNAAVREPQSSHEKDKDGIVVLAENTPGGSSVTEEDARVLVITISERSNLPSGSRWI